MNVSRRAFFFSAVSLFAQEPKFSSDVRVVNMLATVRDKKGQIIRDLTKDDFTLQEDGRQQTIGYFSKETDLPLTLGLMVDTSGSQRRVLAEEQRASYRFLEQVLREDKDLAFVLHFDREVELLQDVTSSKKKLEASLRLLTTPQVQWGGRNPRASRGGRGGPGTLLYDSVLLASDELMRKQHGRKALIMLTDGVDNGSRVNLLRAIEASQRADTLVYSILFYDEEGYGGGFGGGRMGGRRGGRGMPPMRPDGRKILERLSKETGAAYFAVSRKLKIDQIYNRIEEELRNQYSLGYTPETTGAAPGYRKIRLTAKQKGLIVQTRDGYYAGE